MSVWDIIRGLKECYHLSTALAWVLAFGGFFLIHKIGQKISLHDIAKHNKIEHDASLVHANAGEKTYAPTDIIDRLVDELVLDAISGDETFEGPGAGDGRILMSAHDVGKARVRRERDSNPLDALHSEIARGEMAIVLGMWNTKLPNGREGVPVEWLREWIQYERMPKTWKHDHIQSLPDTVHRSSLIRKAMKDIRQTEFSSRAISDGLPTVFRTSSSSVSDLLLRSKETPSPPSPDTASTSSRDTPSPIPEKK